eukprot:EC097126.1.p1 GENE.EC097126.1~~EC097126.1.p1  ORF type:complete len:146 (-),score=5.75 EC097126.1:25-462(-)
MFIQAASQLIRIFTSIQQYSPIPNFNLKYSLAVCVQKVLAPAPENFQAPSQPTYIKHYKKAYQYCQVAYLYDISNMQWLRVYQLFIQFHQTFKDQMILINNANTGLMGILGCEQFLVIKSNAGGLQNYSICNLLKNITQYENMYN